MNVQGVRGVTVPTVPARKRVIVLDDDLGLLKAVGRLLRAQGVEAELFSSVQDFQSGAELRRAICVVLDIDVGGESGIEVGRQLVAKDPAMPVVFMTGNDSEGTRQVAMEGGCSTYLPKPFSAKSLIEAIEKASAESAGRNQEALV